MGTQLPNNKIHKKKPYVFDEFFASGREETLSPFLTLDSRAWGHNVPLKSALLSSFFLFLFFVFHAFDLPLAPFFLAVVYCLSGTPALRSALEDLRQLSVNIDVLMTLAAFLSVVIGSGAEGALLLVLFALSGSMEEMVSKKTKGALQTLSDLSPKTAQVIGEAGHLVERSTRDTEVGTLILVQAGEVVPLDGKVVSGSSFVSLVHLTGESAPIRKEPGQEVPAGARCIDGSLTLQVTHSSHDSTVSRIAYLITQAEAAKPQVQRVIDQLDRGYALTIMSLFFFFCLTLPWILSIPYLGTEGAIYRALSFLIAASPCALVIATPTAYLSAITACAKKGILLKGGITFDALLSCKTAAFDKTGTLTKGELSFLGISKLSELTPLSEGEALAIAYGLEQNAVHPIAKAICHFAQKNHIQPIVPKRFRIVPGEGLEAELEDRTFCRIGSSQFIASRTHSHLSETLYQATQESASKILIYAYLLVADDLFQLCFTDEIRPDMDTLIHSLRHEYQMDIVMLTGDREENAQAVGQSLAIDRIHAGLSPEEKLAIVSELSQKEGLLMVGDGLNDAAALARATVGISMGKVGSTTAIDASDIVFLQDRLSLLTWLLKKAGSTSRIVRQNLTLALAVILFASLPALLGLIPLWLAVILHEGGTLLVGLNSLRLLR